MDVHRNTNWLKVALVVVLAIAAPLTAGAQNPNPGGRVTEPYTPAKDAKDLKAVLFNWMWGTGMLKGHDERDMGATLEYQAKRGTIQVSGRPCTQTKDRASTQYKTSAPRIQHQGPIPKRQAAA